MGNSNKTGQANYCGKANCELGRNVRKRMEGKYHHMISTSIT
ncbi:MAG: hypothetical protein WAJ93_04650 [Candidatus Nitrosopolaris sp.]